MKNILLLNEISKKINDVFTDDYKLSKTEENPDAIMVRSFKLHDYPFKSDLLAIARCGAGVNNIPVDDCASRGIVVFNTPGANANAVKELAILSLLIGSRKVVPAIEWVESLKGSENIAAQVEKGKSNFIGQEIIGKKLGVVGLGAVGAQVANAAEHLGMDVLGYDPYISVEAAWSLSRRVRRCTNLATLFAESDYISLHLPLLDSTRDTVNADSLKLMKDGIVIINLARGELVNNTAIISAVKSGKVDRYITDFPQDDLVGIDNIICIPHLGASTPEAEDNCAVAAAKEIMDFLENGNIRNSVNFGSCVLEPDGKPRITLIHKNIAEMINKITSKIGAANINIANYINKSKGAYAYSILDLDAEPTDELVSELKQIEGMIRVRKL